MSGEATTTTAAATAAAVGADADARSKAAHLPALQPVHDTGAAPPTGGIGLCLSGGGYRAMLFHLGALWRLNELGLLRGLTRVSSVSGGSIVGATLGARWGRLAWSPENVATNFADVVAEDIHALAARTLDVAAVASGGLLPGVTIGERIAHAYADDLFGDATLQDLPDPAAGAPLFVICATNLESGALFRFARPYLADHRVGMVHAPTVRLSDAVAASSAFPPVLSPFEIDLRGAAWETVDGNDLTDDRWRERVTLSDGGVYDNLGLETVWKDCATVLISDGGGHLADDPDPPHDWPRQTLRVLT